MGLKGSSSDAGLAFRCRLARSVTQKMSNRIMTTTTREPTVTPAIAPGPKPPESLDDRAVVLATGGRDGPGSSVVFEGISVFVVPGVALGKALILSASRSAAWRSKVLFVSEMLREAQEGSSIASGTDFGNWPISISLGQFSVHVV